jgi:uncharacterized coiled-coil protein SlyX
LRKEVKELNEKIAELEAMLAYRNQTIDAKNKNILDLEDVIEKLKQSHEDQIN